MITLCRDVCLRWKKIFTLFRDLSNVWVLLPNYALDISELFTDILLHQCIYTENLCQIKKIIASKGHPSIK